MQGVQKKAPLGTFMKGWVTFSKTVVELKATTYIHVISNSILHKSYSKKGYWLGSFCKTAFPKKYLALKGYFYFYIHKTVLLVDLTFYF